MKVGDLVRVEWNDSYTYSATWLKADDREDFIDSDGFLCTSVGWVTHIDGRHVTLHADHGNDAVGRLMRIPKGCITKVRTYR